MNPRRLVIVTRRFWPLHDATARVLQRLAHALTERHWQVTVLTALWLPDGPREFRQGNVRVIHVGPAPRGWRETYSYGRRVAAWLRAHRAHWDLVLVSGLGADAYAVLASRRKDTYPVLLRAERAGEQGDCHRQLTMCCGARVKRACQRADALLAPTELTQRELIAAGYPRPRIHPLPPGRDLPPPVTSAQRAEARAALSQIDPSLSTSLDAQVVLIALAATDRPHWQAWLEQLRHGIERLPQVRWWVTVDAPLRDTCRLDLQAAGLEHHVTILGDFDDLDDVFIAADALVQLSPADEPRWEWIEALAWGLRVIVTTRPDRPRSQDADGAAWVVHGDDPAALFETVAQALASSTDAARRAELGQAYFLRHFHLPAIANAFIERCEASFAPPAHASPGGALR